MNNYNLTIVEGFLVKDPEYTKLKSNIPLCKFTIGNNQTFVKKNGEKVKRSNFFEITTWMRMAENCSKFLKKGSRIIVSGSLKKETWKDKEGKHKQKVVIEGQKINFLN